MNGDSLSDSHGIVVDSFLVELLFFLRVLLTVFQDHTVFLETEPGFSLIPFIIIFSSWFMIAVANRRNFFFVFKDCLGVDHDYFADDLHLLRKIFYDQI